MKKVFALVLSLVVALGCFTTTLFAAEAPSISEAAESTTVKRIPSILSLADHVTYTHRINRDGSETITISLDFDDEKYGFDVGGEARALDMAFGEGSISREEWEERKLDLYVRVATIQAASDGISPRISDDRQKVKRFTVNYALYEEIVYTANLTVVGTYSNANNYAQIDKITVTSHEGSWADSVRYSVEYDDETAVIMFSSYFVPIEMPDSVFLGVRFTLYKNGSMQCEEYDLYLW